MRRAEQRLLGEGVSFVSVIDTPGIGSHAKRIKERKLALIAKEGSKSFWLKRDCALCSAAWSTKHKLTRPLINIYRTNGEKIGKKLLKEGFARTWSPEQRNDYADSK